jgi:hypothetical protein
VKRLQLPVAAVQGMWMRSTTKMAPPATGPTSGTVGTTSRTPLCIAVVGESTAAGCGVDNHDDGFTGCLAREITARTQRPVLNVAVLLAGGNDVMSGRSLDQWRDDVSAIVDDLMERADHVVVAGIPPFALFPSMPTTLGRYLSERAAALDDVSRQICAVRPCTTWVTMTEVPPPDFFASDRFHLSAAGYQRWAQVVADHLVL